jgi:hypothetical protein
MVNPTYEAAQGAAERCREFGAFEAQAEGDVLGHAQVGKESVVLIDEADASMLRRDLCDITPVDEYASPVRLEEAGDRLQQDGLAGAGRAEHHEVLTGGDVQIYAAEVELLQVDG